MVTVIAVCAVTIVLVLRPDSSSGPDTGTPTATGDSEFASANDTGPANIITEDPTCEAWGRIAQQWSRESESVGWADRDWTVPASDWTPAQRAMYETVGKALTNAARMTENLVKQTPHRVMRELYGQFIVYAQESVDAFPSYEAKDDSTASVAGGLISALSNICAAIDYKAVQSVAPLIEQPALPTQPAVIDSMNEAFLPGENSICPEWIETTDRFADDTAAWLGVDGKISATDWTPEQRAIYDAVVPIMSDHAESLDSLGRESANPVLEDFAVLAAQYSRAYVAAIPNYTSRDNFLSQASSYLAGTVYWACKASV